MKVLVLDDDKDLGKMMHDMFLLLGAEAVHVFHSLEELQKNREKALSTQVALLDVNLGNHVPTGIDAFHWLIAQGYAGRVAFFTGHATSHPLVRAALEIPNTSIIEKPAPMSQLESLLK